MYRIVSILSIDMSLLSQLTTKTPSSGTQKALLLNLETKEESIHYFVSESKMLGIGTTLILHSNSRILYKNDYKISHQEEYNHNTKFITRLLTQTDD
ncbi:hypothetical protein ECANGB1_1880 [Enterospora canceri]|uniref:Uncharacterized protein n=1 Tax=Enterospora canceri TaxID=1081671 RepID=A0A1Y1S8Y8_9MICR|nr:hypothetical protein ECANGB1_1880 [Enterospora canceri]